MRLIMELDYKKIGSRIAARRKKLGLKQSKVEERAKIGYKYLSNIERGISIPSLEVIMRLSAVLDTTPDEFLLGAADVSGNDEWKSAADMLRKLNSKQLSLVKSFIKWVSEQKI